jgi:hypothetical protein
MSNVLCNSGLLGEQVNRPTIINPGAQSGASTGWTVEAGNWFQTSVDPSARVQSPYFAGGNQPSSIQYQEIDLVTHMPRVASVADLNALLATFELSCWQSNYATNDPGSISIRFKDASRVTLETHTSSERYLNRYWRQSVLKRLIPVGTQYVDIRMIARRTSGTNNNANFDDFSCTVRPHDTAPIVISSNNRAWAGSGDNLLQVTHPSTALEGDLMVLTVCTRNKWLKDYHNLTGAGWAVAIGADMLSTSRNSPWTNAGNEQMAVFWKVATASEPATHDVGLLDAGTDYALGSLLIVRGIASPSVLAVTHTNSATVPSVEMKKGGIVVGAWCCSDSAFFVGNHTENYPFVGQSIIEPYGNVSQYVASFFSVEDGFTGDVAASGAKTTYACNTLVSFQPN